MKHLTRHGLAAAALAALCAHTAQAQSLYAYRLNNQAADCYPIAINDSGQIAGKHNGDANVGDANDCYIVCNHPNCSPD